MHAADHYDSVDLRLVMYNTFAVSINDYSYNNYGYQQLLVNPGNIDLPNPGPNPKCPAVAAHCCLMSYFTDSAALRVSSDNPFCLPWSPAAVGDCLVQFSYKHYSHSAQGLENKKNIEKIINRGVNK